MKTLISLLLACSLSSLVWAQDQLSGSFTDGQTMTIELQPGSAGLQGSLVFLEMNERIPMQITQNGEEWVATANVFGEMLQFTIAPSGNDLRVGVSGQQVIFQRTSTENPTMNSAYSNPSETNEQRTFPEMQRTGTNPNANLQESGSTPNAQSSTPSTHLKIPLQAEVESKYEGYAFQPPDGWRGDKNEELGAWMYGSDTIPGLMIVYADKSKGTTRQRFQQWIQSEMATVAPNVTLRPSSPCQSFGQNGIYCDFSGKDEVGSQLQAITAGVIDPEGRFLAVTSITTSTSFTQEHVDRTVAVADSARFFQPLRPPIDQKWVSVLSNRKLTHMSSSSSSGYDGSYTASSTRESYGFCPDGSFHSNSSDSYSVNAGGGMGSQTGSGSTAMANGGNAGQGRWTVFRKQNQSILELTYHNGNVVEMQISYDEDSKTYLDGTRYFKTGGTSGPAPDCP